MELAKVGILSAIYGYAVAQPVNPFMSAMRYRIRLLQLERIFNSTVCCGDVAS